MNINQTTSVQYVMDQCRLHTKLQNFFGVGQITGEPGCGIATRINQMLLQRRMAWKFNRMELGPPNTAGGNFFVTQQGFQDIRHAGACIFALLNSSGGSSGYGLGPFGGGPFGVGTGSASGTLPVGGVGIDLAAGIVINNQPYSPLNGPLGGLSLSGSQGGSVTGFSIATGGTLYNTNDTLGLVEVGGVGCTMTVGSVGAGGVVLGVVIAAGQGGKGYTVANNLATTTTGAGAGCTINILSVTPPGPFTFTVQTLDPHPFQPANIGNSLLYISGAANPAFNSVFTWNQLTQQSQWTQGYTITAIPDNQHLQLALTTGQVSGTITAISQTGTTVTITVPNSMAAGDVLLPLGLTVNQALINVPVTLTAATATTVTFTSSVAITNGAETGVLIAANSGARGIFNFGWLESASIQDINSLSFPQPVKPVDAVHRIAPNYTTTGEELSVAAVIDFNNGVIKFRLSEPMGTYCFQINLIYQARAPKLTTAQSVFQWPDDLSYVLVEMALWQASRFAYGVAGEETMKLEQSAMAALMGALESEDKEANDQALTPIRTFMGD